MQLPVVSVVVVVYRVQALQFLLFAFLCVSLRLRAFASQFSC